MTTEQSKLQGNAPDTTLIPPTSDEPEAIVLEALSRYPSWLIVLTYASIAIILLSSITLNLWVFMSPDGKSTADIYSSLWTVVILLSLISIVSVASAFWLYYGRVLLLKDGPALVPEKWGSILNNSTRKMLDSQGMVRETVDELMKRNEKQAAQGEALMKSFLTLQEALDRRDAEIDRLKKGYDTKVFKRFLSRFIRVDSALLEIAEEAKETDQFKNYHYLSRMMEDALDECGVERYSPELGDDYREAGRGVADEPKVFDTDDQEQDFKIAAVDSEGYIVRGEADTFEAIAQARVTIYRFAESSGDTQSDKEVNENE